ncbi:hypothetical protein GCM10010915_02110 [Microbacterium faecale]|uniref:SnoaL-like domain-containing protein n=1 Tax=Microbacterium faecale TaxID=1804630 RepID=A0A916Y0U3_9MICO|nr:nuclear transport factor 2 family protein [Microbacterium faecale]GGD25680.1 hypothetical protein GCM10010915_02110 [Microbacterium faecale]
MSQDPVSMLEKYVEAFNAGDFETLVDFYHDDLYLNVSRGTELRGKQSVVDHYTGVRSMSQRTMTIDRAFSSGNQLAAEFVSEFAFLADDENFPSGPVRAGDKLFVHTFVHYELRDGLIWRGRSATFQRRWERAGQPAGDDD